MSPLPFKAIAFDVDDTLTESKQALHDDMGILLSRLTEKVPVAIISGGKLTQLEEQLVRRLPHPNFKNFYLFPTGGASGFAYTDDGDRVTLYENNLSEVEIKAIFSAAEKIINDTKVIEGQTLYGDIIENRGTGVAISLLGQMTSPDIKRTFDPDQVKRKKLRSLLVQALPDFEIKIGGMTTIDISKKGIDKAYGMHEFSKIVQIEEENMLYIGDALYEGGNDAAIFKTKMQIHKVTSPDDTKLFLDSLFHA